MHGAVFTFGITGHDHRSTAPDNRSGAILMMMGVRARGPGTGGGQAWPTPFDSDQSAGDREGLMEDVTLGAIPMEV